VWNKALFRGELISWGVNLMIISFNELKVLFSYIGIKPEALD